LLCSNLQTGRLYRAVLGIKSVIRNPCYVQIYKQGAPTGLFWESNL
jgi:hypothetical protein